jgi:diguanylate cyclase (GGDEF)-like protein
MPDSGRPGAPRAPRSLFAGLGALALLIPVYVLAPIPDPLRQGLYLLVGAAAVSIGFLGLRHNRPERPCGWLLVLCGAGGWVAGDLIWTIEQHVLPNQYPAPSDAVYLAAYLTLGAGSLVFVRSRHGSRDSAAILDAAIVTTGVGVLVGVFMIAPLAADSTLSPAAKTVSAAYPLADLFLLGVLARLYAAIGARTLSYRLLTASLTFTLTADVWYEVDVLLSGSAASTLWTDAGWLAGYLLLATAACVPSMRRLVEPEPDAGEATPTRRRLTALAGGLMLPGLVLLLDGVTGGDVHWLVIGVGTLLLSAMVLVRMVGLLKVVQVQAVRLSALARSDSLTGAPNRRTWDHELPRACTISRERGTSLCVAILDLDRFKLFNDTHGHQAGDRLLREAVAAWSEVLPANALLARYGGEEFAVLIPGVSAAEMERVLHRLRVVTPAGQTFSAGVAVWDPRTEPATAIAGADQALYVAKRSGRDRVVVHGQEPRLQMLADRLRADRSLPPFTIVTQPIVDLTTSTVSSHEALARFSELDADAEVQDVFRRAHTAGNGDLLELAAIQAALALHGRPEGHDLYVNVSAQAVTSTRFLAGLPQHLHGVVIELSEDPGDVALTRVAEAIKGLRERGARIALDDAIARRRSPSPTRSASTRSSSTTRTRISP